METNCIDINLRDQLDGSAVFCFGFNDETTVQTIRERNRGILLVLQINVPDRDLYRDRARI